MGNCINPLAGFSNFLEIAISSWIAIRNKKGVEGGREEIFKTLLLDSIFPKSYVNYLTEAVHIVFDYVSAAYLPL
jgi:hypothetical protein